MKLVHAISGEAREVDLVVQEHPKHVIARHWCLPEDDLILLTDRGAKVDVAFTVDAADGSVWKTQWILFFQKSLLDRNVPLPLFFPLRDKASASGRTLMGNATSTERAGDSDGDVVSLEDLHAFFPTRFYLQSRAMLAVRDNLASYRDKLRASLDAFKRQIEKWQMRFTKCRETIDADLEALKDTLLHPALELRQKSLADLLPVERIRQFAVSLQNEIPLIWIDVDKLFEKLDVTSTNATQVCERLSLVSADDLTGESRGKLGHALRAANGDAPVASCELQQRWSERCRIFLGLLREVALSQSEIKHLFSRGMHLEERVNGLKNRAAQLEHVGQLPQAYTEALHEVNRRRAFRAESLKIAQEAAERLRQLEDHENEQRERFLVKYGHHLPNGFLPAVTQGSKVVPVKLSIPDSWDDVLPVLGSFGGIAAPSCSTPIGTSDAKDPYSNSDWTTAKARHVQVNFTSPNSEPDATTRGASSSSTNYLSLNPDEAAQGQCSSGQIDPSPHSEPSALEGSLISKVDPIPHPDPTAVEASARDTIDPHLSTDGPELEASARDRIDTTHEPGRDDTTCERLR